jgi:hypothetical protein
MGRLVKMEFPYHNLIVCPGSGPYVRYDTSGRTFGLETVRPLRVFQGEPHFLSTVHLFFDSRAIKDFLKPPNSKYNLHAT